jgi:hypothetical protein
MATHSTQRHNILAVGETNGMIAAAFPPFARDTATLATRSVHWPDTAAALDAWPAALFQDKVAFNWLFLDAGDLPAACRLIRLAQRIAPTLLYCHVPETGPDAAQVAALLEAESSKDGFGLILSCHAASDCHAHEMMRAFLRGGTMERRAPARPAQEVRAHDPCYAPARELILSSGAVSLSLVQRTLRIGYTRASQLIDAMVGDVLVRDRLTGAVSLREG